MAENHDAEYELVLMLDPEVPDERRETIAADARKRIEAAGSLRHADTWGMRKLAYEIRQRTEADYRFFRFETGGGLLEELNHTLKIADGVLRFRLFKVDPRSPVIAPPPPVAVAAARPRRPERARATTPAASEGEAGEEGPPAEEEEAAPEPAEPGGEAGTRGEAEPESEGEAAGGSES